MKACHDVPCSMQALQSSHLPRFPSNSIFLYKESSKSSSSCYHGYLYPNRICEPTSSVGYSMLLNHASGCKRWHDDKNNEAVLLPVMHQKPR